jgi:hypothetical protein
MVGFSLMLLALFLIIYFSLKIIRKHIISKVSRLEKGIV